MIDKQTENELEIFRKFASACELCITLGSIEKRPEPEPDILCALIKGEQVAFEMVQVIDQEKIGRRRGNQNLLDSHFEQIHRSLALKSQDRPPKKRILIKLQPSSSLRSRMSLATKIIEQLMLAGPNLEGELLLSPDLKKLASVKVGREKRLSPFFDLSLPTHYNAVPLAAVDNKFEKSYITRFPMELLAYYDAQDVPPESETKRLYALLDDRLSQSSFRRAWVFDFRQHRVCYQTMLSETDVTGRLALTVKAAERRARSSDAKLHSNGVDMTKDEALQYKRRWQLVNDFIAEEIRTARPEVRFQQLRTMIATAHRLRQPDPTREAAASGVRERWRLLRERLHASS